MKIIKCLLAVSTVVSLLVGLTGCNTVFYGQEYDDIEVPVSKASVRNMASGQVFDPEASARNGAEVNTQLEGQKAEQVLNVYRKDVSKGDDISNEIHINVGN